MGFQIRITFGQSLVMAQAAQAQLAIRLGYFFALKG